VRLLWLSHFVPFPPRGGNLQRSFNLIRQASYEHEIHLMALNLLGETAEKLHEYETELKQYCQSVEICDLPFPWRGKRWWAKAIFSPFFPLPFSCGTLFSKSILARWEQLLHVHSQALLHFDSIDLALYAQAATNFKKVLNHHNCESALAYRQAQKEGNLIQKKYLLIQAAKLSRAERAFCPRFDLNLVVSEQDRQLFQTIQPKARYHLVENGVDIHHFAPSSEQAEAHSAIFNAWLAWGPNISAMNFLVREVWPQVRERFPDARLYLAGKDPPEHVRRWPKEDPSILVVPNPEDMRPWIARAAVCVCPILEGGGTRLKVLDAMAMGKPTLSTTIGCEGLRVAHGQNILIADTAKDFAARLLQLFDREDLRRQLGRAGRSLVEQEYCWERIGQQLQQAYRCAVSHIAMRKT
jgi:glycosyltransferase involved in cell wall biosynthesis